MSDVLLSFWSLWSWDDITIIIFIWLYSEKFKRALNRVIGLTVSGLWDCIVHTFTITAASSPCITVGNLAFFSVHHLCQQSIHITLHSREAFRQTFEVVFSLSLYLCRSLDLSSIPWPDGTLQCTSTATHPTAPLVRFQALHSAFSAEGSTAKYLNFELSQFDWLQPTYTQSDDNTAKEFV